MIIDELYQDWMDEIIHTVPLVQSHSNAAVDINTRLINNIHTIRRTLQTGHSFLSSDRVPSFLSESFYRTWNEYFDPNTNANANANANANTNVADDVSVLFQEMLDYVLDLNNNTNLANLTNLEDVKVTISKQDFDKLPRECISEENVTRFDKDCNICIDKFEKDTTAVTLACGHYFHEPCIRDWLCKEKVTCPVCRKDSRDSPVSNLNTI
jgi:hypothetical protein